MVGLCALVALAACSSGDRTADDEVGPAEAITAIVAWQADEQEPVLDENGEEQLPVIFVVARDGDSIDVGVQADVAAATADWAMVRFADDAADAFDPDLEGEPVRDDGVLLLVGPMPDPDRSIELEVVRHLAVDVSEPITLQITAVTDDSDPDTTRRASVTAVTQP